MLQAALFGQQEAVTIDGRNVILYEDGSWSYPESSPFRIQPSSIPALEIPATSPEHTIISHTGFSLTYNESHEQANWVAYELTREKTVKVAERTDKFLSDPKVTTGTAVNQDYTKSGYDKGHLAPAADMSWSEIAMNESFYFSNISPQLPGFNRGIWKRLEELVRTWAVENDAIYIVTGPVLSEGLQSIGTNKVSIPDYFYKVILDYSAPDIKGIGFIFPHASSNEPLFNYAVSIDSIELLTGIDFFPSLPDSHEILIEKTLCIPCWTWNNKVDPVKTEEPTASNQCKGATKSGSRCKNKISGKDEYCHLHKK